MIAGRDNFLSTKKNVSMGAKVILIDLFIVEVIYKDEYAYLMR